jgi:hypothetical protein
MLSFVAAILRVDQSKARELSAASFEDLASRTFDEADTDGDGSLLKRELFNYLIDNRVTVTATCYAALCHLYCCAVTVC